MRRPGNAALGPGEGVGARIRDAYLAISRAFRVRVARHAITSEQWFFLRVLWHEEGLSQRELSRRVGISEPTTVAAMKLLVRNGLVEKRMHPADRRVATIHLTRKGRALRAQLLPYAEEINNVALAGFSAKETDLLLQLLARVRANVLEHESGNARRERL